MDQQMYHYATVSKALAELNEKGYTVDYNLQEDKIINSPQDFTIQEVYRYEGQTDPGDEATVFGIRSSTGELGTFVAGMNAYTENTAAMVLNELFIKGRQEHNENK
ncbi:hypothetical protein [Flavobacterium sp.]|uniref:hypothetical protein n=1 Tax=Flavobacterium sp. TaxID=239 RepID=UPI00260C7CBB|nr:hypothetical protein [Flavobacterium sp.]MDD3005166.1 hypothetical protein [Flavobacterium sp.]